jgi:hypothetical protein
MIMDVKNIINSDDGQGLIEFLLFLPLMLMMYSVTLSISNSINASINQQKIARGYFYYRMQNNSMIPKPRRGGQEEPSKNWNVFGMQIIGWNVALENNRPVAPCYKMNLPFASSDDDSCEESYSDRTTQFIRVLTVYGVCGATYYKEDNYNVAYPITSGAQTGASHCTISI